MKVKVGSVPGTMKVVENVSTASEAISVARISTENSEVRLNGTKITDMSTTLKDGDSVVVIALIKGN